MWDFVTSSGSTFIVSMVSSLELSMDWNACIFSFALNYA